MSKTIYVTLYKVVRYWIAVEDGITADAVATKILLQRLVKNTGMKHFCGNLLKFYCEQNKIKQEPYKDINGTFFDEQQKGLT